MPGEPVHGFMSTHGVPRTEDRDADGRFSGLRVNVEQVPRLPTFPARWVLEVSERIWSSGSRKKTGLSATRSRWRRPGGEWSEIATLTAASPARARAVSDPWLLGGGVRPPADPDGPVVSSASQAKLPTRRRPRPRGRFLWSCLPRRIYRSPTTRASADGGGARPGRGRTQFPSLCPVLWRSPSPIPARPPS
jgi:hypothetical protein